MIQEEVAGQRVRGLVILAVGPMAQEGVAGQRVRGLVILAVGLIETFKILDSLRSGRRWLARKLVTL